MTNKIMYPSLSEDGWVNSSMKIADYLLSCFFISDYSQTYIYTGYVHSLPWILQDTQGDMTAAVTAVQSSLNAYFSRYFNNVEVEVIEVPNLIDPSKAQISIYVKFTDSDNVDYNLAKLLEISDTTVEKIIKVSNGS